jgi:hypothetical protein
MDTEHGFEYISPMGKSVTVRGYEIKRCPIGRMVSALELIATIPRALIDAVTGGMSRDQLLASLVGGQEESVTVFMRALAYAPKPIMEIIGRLLNIPSDRLLADEDLGIMGLMELLGAWCEVNEIINFTLALKMAMAVRRGDCTDSSRQDCISALGSASCSRITTLGKFLGYLTRGKTTTNP